MHVLDVKRHITITNIARRLQNGPYLLLSILKFKTTEACELAPKVTLAC